MLRHTILTFGLILMLALSLSTILAAEDPDKFDGKIAYLQNGDVYIADADGSASEQITKTNGEVAEFLFSPALRYLAYTKIFGMVESPGLYEDDEEVPQTEIYSIVFVDLTTMSTVAVLEPEGEWLNPVRWTADDRLFYYWSSGYDVSRFFEYNVTTQGKTELDYVKGPQLLDAGISSDSRLLAYTDDIGLGKTFQHRLHLLKAETGEDRVIASSRSLFLPCFSNDNESIAFLTVETVDSQSIDNIWVYSLESDSLKKISSVIARPKSDCRVQWSTGDSCLGIFYAPGYPPNGYVLAINAPADIHEISGNDFCWISDSRLLFGRGEDIFAYDMNTRESALFIENASRPAYLSARD